MRERVSAPCRRSHALGPAAVVVERVRVGDARQDAGMLLAELAATSAAVAATRSRLAKRALLVELLRRTPEADVAIVSRYLGGELRQRRTGLGWRSLSSLPAPS